MKIKYILADPKHWVKGLGNNWENENYTCCILTAAFRLPNDYINTANERSSKIKKAVEKLFPEKIERWKETDIIMNRKFLSISLFNDDPETTHEMVMAVLNEADV